MQQRSFVGCGPGCACFVVAAAASQLDPNSTTEFFSNEAGMFARQRGGEVIPVPEPFFAINEDGRLDFGPGDKELGPMLDIVIVELEALVQPSLGDRFRGALHSVGAFLSRGASYLPLWGRPALS